MLAIAAVILLVVFVVVTTHGSPKQLESTRIGILDEGAIKQQEEILKQKLSPEEPLTAGKTELKGKLPTATDIRGKTNQELSQGTEVAFDPAQELQSILSLSPVVMFSKTYCGYSKALKNLLAAEYEISPPPTIVELDKHKKGAQLQEYIGTKTGRQTVPNLFINGVSRGGSDDMRKFHDEGKLLKLLTQWGGKSVKVTKINAPSNS